MIYSILGSISEGDSKVPICLFRVRAGFPSPAADHIEAQISLDEVLNILAPHVYLVLLTGESMQGAGIYEGDPAIVDGSIEPAYGYIVIARSYDAKVYVKMGQPHFQIKHKLKQHGIVQFSSNYALYGGMSERVMKLIESIVSVVEVYSIDEACVDLTGINDVDGLGRKIRSQVLRCTGIPVGVGIAHTKTLAELDNHTVKHLQAQTGGVVNICDPAKRDCVLRNADLA